VSNVRGKRRPRLQWILPLYTKTLLKKAAELHLEFFDMIFFFIVARGAALDVSDVTARLGKP